MSIRNGKPEWRTKETFEKYLAHREEKANDKSCDLCATDSVVEYTHWRIIHNRFPYDRIAKVHDMILPKRHTAGDDLTEEEKRELSELSEKQLADTYCVRMIALARNRSIPDHLHYHLLVPKDIN